MPSGLGWRSTLAQAGGVPVAAVRSPHRPHRRAARTGGGRTAARRGSGHLRWRVARDHRGDRADRDHRGTGAPRTVGGGASLRREGSGQGGDPALRRHEAGTGAPHPALHPHVQFPPVPGDPRRPGDVASRRSRSRTLRGTAAGSGDISGSWNRCRSSSSATSVTRCEETSASRLSSIRGNKSRRSSSGTFRRRSSSSASARSHRWRSASCWASMVDGSVDGPRRLIDDRLPDPRIRCRSSCSGSCFAVLHEYLHLFPSGGYRVAGRGFHGSPTWWTCLNHLFLRWMYPHPCVRR